MLEFFQQRFSYIHQLNLSWIAYLTELDTDYSKNIENTISKIINSRHIFVSRITNREPDSELEDYIPQKYWQQLEVDNSKQITTLFHELNDLDYEDLDLSYAQLFHILHQNALYLGELRAYSYSEGLDGINELVLKVE